MRPILPLLRTLSLLAPLALVVPPAARAASGPPDAFGYTWSDQDEPGIDPTIPIPSLQYPLPLAKDQVSGPILFGFPFPFYGVNYTQFVVSSNGWISFDTSVTDAAPAAAPLPRAPAPNALVAFFWRPLEGDNGGASFHGFIPGGYMVQLNTTVPGTKANGTTIRIALYQSGVIKVSYNAVDLPETASAGIEDAAGAVGQNPSFLGAGQSGFHLAAGAVLEYFPPPKLGCAAPGTIACGQKLTFSSPPPFSPEVDSYVCSTDTWSGTEKVISFDNPALADVSVTVTAHALGGSLAAFLLRRGQCNEFQCLDGGASSLAHNFLPTGSYRIVVDGRDPSDDGDFDLEVQCTPRGSLLPCMQPSDPPVRGSTSGLSLFDSYDCKFKTFNGPEAFFEVPFAGPGNLAFKLTPDPTVLQDLLVFGPDSFDVPRGCIGWGDSEFTLFNASPGTYYAVVDGYSNLPPDPPQPNAGGFGIQVSCGVRLDCSAPAGDLQCYTPVSGTTAGGSNRVEMYSCSGLVHDGPEAVYRFHNDIPRTVAFKFAAPPGLDVMLVQASCDEGTCLRLGSSAAGRLMAKDLAAGDYFLVVDGQNGASGSFTLEPVCGDRVSPASGSWTLDPGTTVHETKALSIRGDPTAGNLMFVFDETNSMGITLQNLAVTAATIVDQLRPNVDDLAFGLASFRDYPQVGSGANCGSPTYGDLGDLPYALELPVSSDEAALAAAVDTLVPSGGGDDPEAYLRAYYEMVADSANVGWRAGARKIAIMSGDDEPHACDLLACAQARAATGVDPGRDAIPGTGDDIEPVPLMGLLKSAGVVPLFLQTNSDAPRLAEWDCWTRLAGGRAYDSTSGFLPGTLVADLQAYIESATLFCTSLTVEPDPGFETWIINLAPPSVANLRLPADQGFDLDLGPPAGTTPGVYTFDIRFVCDGVVKATQAVSVTVPGVCTPSPALTLSGKTCGGDPRALDASASSIPGCNAPAVVEWQWTDSLGNVIQPWSPTGSSIVVTPPASTTFTVEIRCSDQAQCPYTARKTMPVPVDPTPAADAGLDASLCLGDSLRIGTPGLPSLLYSWSPASELDNALIDRPVFATTLASPMGPRVYTLTVTDPASGCQATDTVTLDVDRAAALGAIGNHLLAVRRTADVELEWRSAPLSARDYNVHRETAKTSLSPPGPPLGRAAGDELYTDPSAVPTVGVFFYQVYGRDCNGGSIFN